MSERDFPKPPARKQKSFELSLRTSKALAHQAVSEGRPQYEIVEQAILEYLDRHQISQDLDS